MLPFQLPCRDPAALHLLTRQRPERVCEAGHEMGRSGQGARILVFVMAVVLLKRRGSVTTENRHLEVLEPGHDPDFRVAAQSLKQKGTPESSDFPCGEPSARGGVLLTEELFSCP